MHIRKIAALFLCLTAGFLIAFVQQVSADTMKEGASLFMKPSKAPDYWPTKGWKSKTPEEAGMSGEKLKEMEAYAFAGTKERKGASGIRTDGVVIIRNGYLVYEKYAPRYNRDRVHIIWSCSKSVTNAIFGIAVKEGRIRLEEPAYRYHEGLDRGKHRLITVNDLMRMSSAIYSNETYESSPLKSTVNAMLFSTGKRDMAAFAAALPLEGEPGKKWEYSSPSTNLLASLLKKTMSKEEYAEYPWKMLFNPLGMSGVVWERDASGTFVGSSYVYMTPRDMAKFGFLYLNDGMWEDSRILPEGWVEYSTTVAPGYFSTSLSEEEKAWGTYGALFWLNMPADSKGVAKVCKDVPDEMFYAAGHWGQAIYIIPSLNLVVAITADNRDGSFDVNRFLKLIVDSIGAVGGVK